MAILNGLKTPLVDTSDLQYQADPNYLPDKEALQTVPMHLDGWVFAHNAIRAEVRQMAKIISHLGDRPLKPWEVTAMQQWWAAHYEHVHGHHVNEDDIFTPRLLERIKLPERLSSDHETVVEHLSALAAKFATLENASSLADMWAAYERDLLPHLIEEEKVALPLMRAYFTPAECAGLVQAVLKRQTPVEKGGFFYWMSSDDPDSAETGSINGASIKAATSAFLTREGVPSFVKPLAWHMDLKHCVHKYEVAAAVPAASLFSGGLPPPPKASFSLASCISACHRTKAQNKTKQP